MNSDNFSFSFTIPGHGAGTRSRYIARPFEAQPLGEETIILAAGARSTVQAPLFYAQMLAQCGEFKSLDEHAASVMRTFGLPAEQQPAVRQGLEGLVERGLLQDEQSVYQGLGSKQTAEDVAPAPIESLCIRTCNRPRDLERLLASLAGKTEGTGLRRILVLDDARSKESMAATADVLRKFETRLDAEIFHIDRQTRRQLTTSFAARAGVETRHLQWIIEGDEDDPEASYGANLNLALLLTAGERFLMIDDDATLDPYALQTPEDKLSLRVAHEFEVRFPDPNKPETEQYPRLDLNPIMAHDGMLGHPVAAIAARHGLQNGHLLADLSPQMIHDFTLRPRIRLTTNGTLGDSGTGGMMWLYTLPARQLKPWFASRERYHQLALGRRVARSTSETQIASSVSLMTTTLTGVDNREMLLPVPAKGRGEDLLFGVGIRYLYPGTPCCALPWMLPHRLDSPRQWTTDNLSQRQGASVVGYLSAGIEDLADVKMPDDSLARTRVLAEWLQGLAEMQHPALLNDLRRYVVQRRADAARNIGATLNDLEQDQLPAWLREDFTRMIDRQKGLAEDEEESLAKLVPKVRHFAAQMGKTLPAWMTAWQWAAGTEFSERTGFKR